MPAAVAIVKYNGLGGTVLYSTYKAFNTMKAFELFFMFGPAVQCLFRLGVLPQNEDFVELTEEERNLYFKHNQRTDEKVFRLKLLVEDSLYTDNVVCMTEIEKETLLNAVEFINKYGKDKTFSTNEDKLRYVASRLPEIFSKGTKFEISD